MRLLITACICLLLTACASPTSVGPDFRFDPATRQALIVGSITYEDGLGVHAIEATSRDGLSHFYAGVGYSQWPPLGPQYDEALLMKGGTFAVAVKPGQYTLQRWSVLKGARTYSPTRPIGIPFQAVAGQVTYLGNFNFDDDGHVALADRSVRDLPILRSRYKAIGAAAPAVAIRSGALLASTGNDAVSAADMSLYAVNPDVTVPAASADATFDERTMASVQDTVENVGYPPRRTRFFVLAEIDGKRVAVNAQGASVGASRGMGQNMRMVDVERPVPAGRTRLKLHGSLDFAAPIQSIFAAIASGGAREVDGEVEVLLNPDARYRVAGVIDELRSALWLEDVATREVVAGSRVAAAPTAEGLKAAAAPLMYACCNLHFDDERWISDGNYIERPFIAAGTPLQVYEYRKDRAKAVVDGKVTWLGLDNGNKQQTLPQWVAKVALKDDPTPRIGAWPAEVRAAIQAGKVRAGMSKDQVVVALGYPRADLTPSLAAPRWSYLTESDAPYFLIWDADERLQTVDGAPAVRARVQAD